MAENKNPHAGHRKRMRERYVQNGFSGWAEHEILEFILFDVIPRRDTNKMAHEILDRFGSIENMLKAPAQDLTGIKGIGIKTATRIHSQEKIYNFGKNRNKHSKQNFYDDEKPEKLFLPLFEDINREVLYMVCLDSKNRIIRCDLIFEGNFESVNLDVGSMVRIAVTSDAHHVVLAHNHPSGFLVPSESDIVATKIIKSAMELVGVVLKEHIIVADGKCRGMMSDYPFKSNGKGI